MVPDIDRLAILEIAATVDQALATERDTGAEEPDAGTDLGAVDVDPATTVRAPASPPTEESARGENIPEEIPPSIEVSLVSRNRHPGEA